MDPKSLLVLCDDIKLEILSFLPIKVRVKHSRVCKVMGQVVDDSLRLVKKTDLPEDWLQYEVNAKLKTLSKLKSLEVVNFALPDNYMFCQKTVLFLAKYCQRVKRIEFWDVQWIDMYIRTLTESRLPVALSGIRTKFIGPTVMSFVKKAQLKELIVSMDTMALFLQEDSDMWQRVTELDMRQSPVAGAVSTWMQMESMPNLRKISGWTTDGEDGLTQLLKSAPRLIHTPVQIVTNQMIRLLIEAPHKFTGLLLDVRGDFWQDEELLDIHLFEQLLQEKGSNLTELTIQVTAINVRGLMDMMIRHCPRLKRVQVIDVGNNSGGDVLFWYKDWHLEVRRFRRLSLIPLLTLFPGCKTITVNERSFLNPGTMSTWISELREFAQDKRNYCIEATFQMRVWTEWQEFRDNLRIKFEKLPILSEDDESLPPAVHPAYFVFDEAGRLFNVISPDDYVRFL